MLFLKFICANYKENIASDRFRTSTFRAVDYIKPARYVYMARDWTPYQFAFVSPLGQGRLANNLHF